MSEPAIDSERLTAASVHVLYEFHMLEATARVLATGISSGSLLNNALIESFGIHARNLTHFMFPENPHKTDVLATHFFPESDAWRGVRGTLPKELQGLRRRTNKQLAHITYDRLSVDSEARRWYYLEIFTALEALMKCFALNVQLDCLSADWSTLRESDV